MRLFALSLAGALLVFLARIHETLPPLGNLYPAKLIAIPLVLTAVMGLPRELLARAVRSTPVRCVAVIVALAILSVPGSVYPRQSFNFLTGPFPRFLLFFVLVAAGFADRRIFRMSVAALVVGVTLGATRGLAVLDHGRFEIGGTYDPNASAALFVMTVPFALYMASRAGIWRLIGYGSALVLAAAVIKTGSRGGMLGLAVLTPWLLYLAPRRQRFLYAAGVTLGAAFIIATMSDAQRARFATILAPEQDYNMTFREGRIEVWKRGFGYMLSRPMLGVGVDAFSIAEGTLAGKRNEGFGIGYTAAHNSFVQIGAELGVFGLTAFLVMFVSAGYGALQVRRASLGRAAELPPGAADEEVGLANAAIGGLIGAAATGFFLSLAYDPIILFAVGACVGVVIGSPAGPLRRRRGTLTVTPAAPSAHPSAPVPVGPGWRSARFSAPRTARQPRPAQRRPRA